MSQVYSDPKRENDPYSLPDVETFYMSQDDIDNLPDATGFAYDYYSGGPGWYWQACFPGCLPDGDPIGPFDTEEKAIADAQEDYSD